jgi:hypothetical protein
MLKELQIALAVVAVGSIFFRDQGADIYAPDSPAGIAGMPNETKARGR